MIATVTEAPGGPRHVPKSGEGHGSFNVVLHELGHAIDTKFGFPSEKEDFVAAYEADRALCEKRGEPYLQHREGENGRFEVFAETFGRFFGEDPLTFQSLPHLNAYWKNFKIAAPGSPESESAS